MTLCPNTLEPMVASCIVNRCRYVCICIYAIQLRFLGFWSAKSCRMYVISSTASRWSLGLTPTGRCRSKPAHGTTDLGGAGQAHVYPKEFVHIMYVYECMYVCMYVCMYAYVSLCTSTRVYKCTNLMREQVHIQRHKQMNTQTEDSTNSQAKRKNGVYAHKCKYSHVYIYMYI